MLGFSLGILPLDVPSFLLLALLYRKLEVEDFYLYIYYSSPTGSSRMKSKVLPMLGGIIMSSANLPDYASIASLFEPCLTAPLAATLLELLTPFCLSGVMEVYEDSVYIFYV